MDDHSDKPRETDDESASSTAKDPGSFPATQWSMVLRAGTNTDTQAHAALESLCRRYWYPLYTYVRRQGRDHHEAEDCTQEFLARLLATEGVGRARREQGRFRTFLLTALRNFLITKWHRTQAAKRGGGDAPVSLDLRDADDRFLREPRETGLTPEQAFDRNWALGMIDRAVAELRAEYEKSGRGAVFAALRPILWGDAGAESLARHGERLGMNAHAFTVALHRLRGRLAERLRTCVAETVANGSDLDAELRHLIAAVGERRNDGR